MNAPGAVHVADVHIGTGSAVIQGVEVSASSPGAAGSVVVQIMPPAACVAGIPARRLEDG